MPLPSKQKMIRETLLAMIRREFPGGAKLPSEPVLAERIGVARRTLRRTLAELESEGLLIRTHRGTCVRPAGRGGPEIPVTVIVPCPCYLSVGDGWSRYLTQQMILGAKDAAVQAGTYVVTLPITMDNDPEQLDLSQLRHLGPDSMILCHGPAWTPALLPFLCKSTRRCGIISDKEASCEEFARFGTPLCNGYLGDYPECLGDAVRQLYADGIRGRILYLGRNSTDLSRFGRDHFLQACRETGIPCDPQNYVLYETDLPFDRVLARIREIYHASPFNGLIFDYNFFHGLPNDFDFFAAAGIPGHTGLILAIGTFLQNSRLPADIRILYRPYREAARRITSFLLSGDNGQSTFRFRYEFPRLGEFFQRTGPGS